MAHKIDNRAPDCKSLVRELLKVDTSAFASLGAKCGAGGNVSAGLHEFMRAMLDQAIGLLWAPDSHEVRLQTEAGAKAMGYDAKAYNLLLICAYALAWCPRRQRGLKDLALRAADPKVVGFFPADLRRPRPPMAESILVAGTLFLPNFDAIRDAPGLGACAPSVQGLLAELVNVNPRTLISIYYDSKADADAAFARDPDGQCLAGLAAMLTRILRHVPLILQQNIDSVRFFIANKTNLPDVDADNAAASNLSALLTCSLLQEIKSDLGFVA